MYDGAPASSNIDNPKTCVTNWGKGGAENDALLIFDYEKIRR